jgi:hypothetical protein
VVTKNNTVDAWNDPYILQRELDFACEHLSAIPNNESPWNYIHGILEKISFEKDAAEKVDMGLVFFGFALIAFIDYPILQNYIGNASELPFCHVHFVRGV